MAFIDLGKLKFNWQGDWSAVNNYEVDDVVFYDNHSFVCTVTHTANATAPSANLSNWDLMAAGVHFREDGDWSGSSTYYRYDIVRHNSNLYLLSGANDSNNQTPGSAPWSLFQAAPAGNVMNSIGAMEYRNNENATDELVINPTVNKGLTVQEQPKETYPGRSFTYEEDGDYGKAFRTAGSIPPQTYTQTVTVQRGSGDFSDGSYVISGGDRNGGISKKHDPNLTINIGDTIVFNNGTGAHPLEITTAQGQGQPSVTTGTYTGEGTSTVTWDTGTTGGATAAAAGVYYYQCQTAGHTGMVGTITVVDTTNTQGSSTGNGTIDVCRGKSYTITFAGNLSNGQNYDLYTTSGGHSTANFSVTAAEGNSTFVDTTNSGVVWTTGSTQTITFEPNETTPDVVYIGNRNSAMSNNLIINVNDVAYVPSWGTASAAAAPGAADSREFKYWQDWYGGDTADQTSGTPSDVNHGVILPQNTRDPGDKVKVSGTAVGAQQRRVWRGDSSAFAEFTVPDGVEKVRITALGGGGGGGSYSSHYYGGCGGGGGCFVSGEYSVTEGDVIRVTPGHGGYGDYTSVGGTGGTTTVQDNASGTLGNKINISSEGGTGGHFGTSIGLGGDTVTLAGTSLLAGNQYKSAGGNGGYGANSGIGWSPESFVSGGGGSSGSAFGPGFNGGSASGSYDGGYWSSGCGGGGIGGNGGSGSTNYTPSTHFPAGGGGGGGSAGPGEHGGCSGHNHNGPDYVSVSGRGGRGGAGIADTVHINGYVDIMPEVAGYPGSGEIRAQREGDWESLATTMSMELICSAGARYGDGEAAHPAAGWTTALHKEQRFIRPLNENNGHTSRLANNTQVFGAKAWNGILGRLWGGGGAGAQTSNATTTGYACSGGEGGSGAGGGGGCTYSSSHGRGVGTMHAKEWSVWDTANMAWRINDAHRVKAAPGLTSGSSIGTSIGSGTCGDGGHGGACGGGGAGCWSGRDGGWGGIGAGGGGAANAYSPIHPGTGGQGGVGYVLIEWS